MHGEQKHNWHFKNDQQSIKLRLPSLFYIYTIYIKPEIESNVYFIIIMFFKRKIYELYIKICIISANVVNYIIIKV